MHTIGGEEAFPVGVNRTYIKLKLPPVAVAVVDCLHLVAELAHLPIVERALQSKRAIDPSQCFIGFRRCPTLSVDCRVLPSTQTTRSTS